MFNENYLESLPSLYIPKKYKIDYYYFIIITWQKTNDKYKKFFRSFMKKSHVIDYNIVLNVI